VSDPIRELEIAKAQLSSLRTQLATMAELNNSQREILHKVAVERDAAVSALALATNATPGKETCVLMTLDKWTEWHTQLAAATERAEKAEAKLALVDEYVTVRLDDPYNDRLTFDGWLQSRA